MIGRKAAVAAAAVVALVAPPPAPAAQVGEFAYAGNSVAPPWNADIQSVTGQIAVEPSPTSSSNVLRVRLANGDDVAGYNRSEVYGRHGSKSDYTDPEWGDRDGTERWYVWSTYFPDTPTESFPSVSHPLMIAQWHSVADGSPPLAVVVRNRRVHMDRWNPAQANTASQVGSEAPVQTNAWNTFVAHMKWSAAPGVGFVELSLNGAPLVPKTFWPTEKCCAVQGTAVRPYPNYLKMGIYAGPYDPARGLPTAVLYHGPMRIWDEGGLPAELPPAGT